MVEDAPAIAAQRTTAVIAGPPQDAVRTWMRDVMEFACERSELIRVLFQEVPYIWKLPGVRRGLTAALGTMQDHVLDQHAVPPGRVTDDRLFVIMTSLRAVIVQTAEQPRLRARRDAIADELARMIESYLVAIVRSA